MENSLALLLAILWFGVNLAKVKLISGVDIPLIGMGIGNLPHESIPHVVKDQLGQGVTLVDTAHASNNEKILADAIATFDDAQHTNTRGGLLEDNQTPPIIHVVTKVWYTHLGYERTKLSVQESLRDLQSSATHQIYVHMLLHWPRCDDNVPWMNCEEEENNLPQYVKDAGSPPHLYKSGAFLGSWKALEDIFFEHQRIMEETNKSMRVHSPIIASIGVSNFELNDMKMLLGPANRVAPHIYQGNAWQVFHDPYMMDLLNKHNTLFQAYGVINGVLLRRNEAPKAHHILTDIAREMAASIHSEKKNVFISEATVLLAYFTQANIGLIPRAASPQHRQENSIEAIMAILPHLTSSHIQQLELAIPALMKGEDLHTSVHFMNALNSPIQVHWVNAENVEVLVSNYINPGQVEVQKSSPGHKFVAYDPDRKLKREFVVDAKYGEEQHFKVEL